ncbi:MAG: hypothetical protein IT437_04150 [Phycisphaerales bacterium]|nr:hypothetical protein [Phycisphaerales bacterium]
MASEGPPRLPAFISTSAMLLLSVAVLLSVEQIRPVVREIQRETATERDAVRLIAGHLARAVRGLAGSGECLKQRPVAAARPWMPAAATAATRRPEPDLPGALCRPRDALLNLPPPAASC